MKDAALRELLVDVSYIELNHETGLLSSRKLDCGILLTSGSANHAYLEHSPPTDLTAGGHYRCRPWTLHRYDHLLQLGRGLEFLGLHIPCRYGKADDLLAPT